MQYKLITINSLENIPTRRFGRGVSILSDQGDCPVFGRIQDSEPKPKTTLALIDCISKPVITREELNSYRKKTQLRALK